MVTIFPKNEKKKRLIKILIPFALHNKRLTYQKLPEQLLKLSVLKLDGSSFSFQVARNATIGMLKLAIEEEFSLSLSHEGKILWPLVWRHFCLSYGGQKLISEKDSIQRYGIKDGDQLQFIQHLRIDKAPTQQKSRNCLIKSSSPDARVDDHNQYNNINYYYFPEQDLVSKVTTTLANSFKDLISCSKFPGLNRS
ncbi:hypothetical protein ACJIZ3_005097 [Penstemon smallii]|uniref:SNRNP25 ubiquitin-like domain-containing protein n=1 Tax=Penstemon smallii TaxID=265156 RepID=A0ABD3S438_9LAMI